MSKQLKPEQYEAIKYLAQPKNGGLTLDEVAEAVGVTRQTLYRWRQDIEFSDEIKRQINRNTMDRIPEVLEAMMEASIKNKNANAAKLVLQSVGLLTDRLEVEDRTKHRETHTTDIDEMKAQIERMRQLRKVQ
ncbi:phBC6A51 family helix-turn-helix protein [Metabacillus sp. Hm71]|uniref:phBC6A51 family helix-turn-helix protein n=1 Tax=Metabacillus sp. Hm71 TaxID=3450743 RepID=UPI003F443701